MKTKTTYQEQKERARQIAIEWQAEFPASKEDEFIAAISGAGEYFHKLGRRFGLLLEFRENAIPC